MKNDLLKHYLVAVAIAATLILVYFGAQYKYDIQHGTALRIQVVLFILLITAMEPPMSEWRRYTSGASRRQDVVYWILLVVITAASLGLTYLLGFPLRAVFPAWLAKRS